MEKVFITDKQGNNLGSHLGAFEDEVRYLS